MTVNEKFQTDNVKPTICLSLVGCRLSVVN
jgi:hypothetical protein